MCIRDSPLHYAKLAWESYDVYKTLEERLGYSFEYTITGSLEILHNEEELNAAQKSVLLPQSLGYDVKVISAEEAIAREPVVSKDIVGAIYSPYDGHINPFLLVNAYIQAAKKLGAEVCTYTKVEGFTLENGSITEIKTDKGIIKPKLVICAAGIYSREIGDMLGLKAHVFPERGFCLVSEKLPKVLNQTVCGARQTVSGNIVFGFIADKVEPDCKDRRMYMRGLNWAAKDAVKDFPALKDINIIRSYTGIRCKPDDKFPIIGPTGKIKNFWFHLSHSAFAVSAALSQKVADMVTGEVAYDAMLEYVYSRFND